MNPLQAFNATVIPPMSEDRWNEAIMNVAEQWGDEIEREFKHKYPDYVISPGTRLKPREQYQRFRQLLLDAYTTEMGVDTLGMAREFNWLMDDSYIDHIWEGADALDMALKQGMQDQVPVIAQQYAFPKALPWRGIWVVRWAFTDLQKVFQRVVKENAG